MGGFQPYASLKGKGKSRKPLDTNLLLLYGALKSVQTHASRAALVHNGTMGHKLQ